MARNKVIFGGEVLIDLTADTVTKSTLLVGATAHDKKGDVITGECTYDSDTTDATISVAEMLKDKTGYARGAKLVGTMPNNGAVNGTISTKTGEYTVPQGYHDGSGKVSIDATAVAGLTPQNVRKNVNILGTIGEMEEGAQENAEETKTVTPSKTQQSITPSEGYTCMREVIVLPIPYVESANAAGGITVTIG